MAGWAVNHDFGVDIPFVASHGQINFAVAAVHGRARGRGALGALIAVPVRRLGVLALALASLAIALALDLTVFQMRGHQQRSARVDATRFPTLDFVRSHDARLRRSRGRR